MSALFRGRIAAIRCMTAHYPPGGENEPPRRTVQRRRLPPGCVIDHDAAALPYASEDMGRRPRACHSPVAWIPLPTERHRRVLGVLLRAYGGRVANLDPDAHLAALAIDHGLVLCSSDSDFARFPGLRWVNPLTDPAALT